MLPANVRRVWQSGQSAKPTGSAVAAAAAVPSVSDWESEIDRELKELGLDAGADTQKLQWGEPNECGVRLAAPGTAATAAQLSAASDHAAEASSARDAAKLAVQNGNLELAMQAVDDAKKSESAANGIAPGTDAVKRADASRKDAVDIVLAFLKKKSIETNDLAKTNADSGLFDDADNELESLKKYEQAAIKCNFNAGRARDMTALRKSLETYITGKRAAAPAAAAAGSVTDVPGSALPGAAGSGSALPGATGPGGTPLPLPAPTGDGSLLPLPLPAADEDDPLPLPPPPPPPPPTATTAEDQVILEKIKKIIRDGDAEFGPQLKGLLGITPGIAQEMLDLIQNIADFKLKATEVKQKAEAAEEKHSAFPGTDIVDTEDKFTRAFDQIFQDYDIALGDRKTLADTLLGAGDVANDLPGLNTVVQKIRDGINAMPFQDLRDVIPGYNTLKDKLDGHAKDVSFRGALDGFTSTQADFMNIKQDHTAKIDTPVAVQLALLTSVQGKLDGDALKTQSEESFKIYETASDEWNDGVYQARSDLTFVGDILDTNITPVPWEGVLELSDLENEKINTDSTKWKGKLEEEILRLKNLDGGKLEENADSFIFYAKSAVMHYYIFMKDQTDIESYNESRGYLLSALDAKNGTDLKTIKGCIKLYENELIKIFDQIKDMDDIRSKLKDPANENPVDRGYINAQTANLNAAVEAFNEMLKKNAGDFDKTRKLVNDLCEKIVFLNYDPDKTDPQKATEIYREINSEFNVIKKYSTITRVALREETEEIKSKIDTDKDFEPNLNEFIDRLFDLIDSSTEDGKVDHTIETQDNSLWTPDQQQSWSDLQSAIADFSQYQELDLEKSVKTFNRDFATEEKLWDEMKAAAESLKTLQESESEMGAVIERVKGMLSYVKSFGMSPVSATDPRKTALDHFNLKKSSYKEMHENLYEMQCKIKLLVKWIPQNHEYVKKANEILSDENKKLIVGSIYYEAKIAIAEKLFAPAGPGDIEEEDVDSPKTAPVVPETAIKDANTASDKAVADAQTAFESKNLGGAQKASGEAKAEFVRIQTMYGGADNANTAALKKKWDKAQKFADDTLEAVLAEFLETARLSAEKAKIEHDASLVDKAEIEAKSAEAAFEEIKKLVGADNDSFIKAKQFAEGARKLANDAKKNAEQAASKKTEEEKKAKDAKETAEKEAETAKTDAEKAAKAAGEAANTAAATAASDAVRVAAAAVAAAVTAAGTNFDTEKASAESAETDRKKLLDEAAQRIEDDKTQKKTAAEAAADLAISSFDEAGSAVAVDAEKAAQDVAAAEAARVAAETAATAAVAAAAAATDAAIKATLDLEAKVAKVEKEKAEINKKIAEVSQQSQLDLANLNKTILENNKAFNILQVEKTAADELAAKQKEALDALGVTFQNKNLEAIKQTSEIAVLKAKILSHEGVIAANITAASDQAAKITDFSTKMGAEKGEHDKLKLKKGEVDKELADLKAAKLKLEGEKLALVSEKSVLAGERLTLTSKLLAETSAKAAIQAALNKERGELTGKIAQAKIDAVATYIASIPVVAGGGGGGGGGVVVAAAAGFAIPTEFTDLTTLLETFYVDNLKDKDKNIFLMSDTSIAEMLDLQKKLSDEDITFLPQDVMDRIELLIIFIYWSCRTARKLHIEIATLRRAPGAVDARYIKNLQEWGQKMQQIAKEQYNTSKKVSEFYGGFYELSAPLVEQNLANMPSL